ncbi:MAG: long-chain fatty acid--CoA ligase [Pseudomonadota bacterium]
MSENNVISAFLKTAKERGGATCAIVKEHGKWKHICWNEVSRRVLSMAAALRRMGLKKGDAVAVMATTRLEWTISDCAIMACGGITVPIYCAFTQDRIRTILRDCTPHMAIVEDASVATLLVEAHKSNGFQDEIRIIGVEKEAASVSVQDLMCASSSEEMKDVERGARSLTADDVATYVYTSGTSGELKGVIITHGMILTEIRATEHVFNFSHNDIGLVCLPLAHVLGRLMQFYQIIHGTQSAYAESLEKLAENYAEIKPHFVCGVPRMLEKIHERVESYIEKAPARVRKLVRWGISIGKTRSELIQKKRLIPFELKFLHIIADILVFRRLRSRLGGRLRCFICGGGKLSLEIAKFFHVAGILVLEGYGLTESFAAATVNRPDDFRFGTVGKPVPGVALKIASDGEILLKGPTVFSKYLHRPEETDAAFDSEGWFKTGDLGEYSRDGFLRITGRKKDMIVTAGGKNIAPQRIEAIMSDSPYISHFMVNGDGRKYLTALVTLNEAKVIKYLRNLGHEVLEEHKLSGHPEVYTLIKRHIEEKNSKLARFETIKRFAIIDSDFSVAGGELTPTLKVRRQYASDKYRKVLDSLYE